MPRCALGTTLIAALRSDEPRPARRVVAAVRELGAEALYLHAGLPAALYNELGAELLALRSTLPVLALEAALGALRLGRPRAALASPTSRQRDEAEAASQVACAAVALAAELGAPFVVLPLGAVAGLERRWEELRGRYLRGELLEDDTAAAELRQLRDAAAGRHIDAGLRSLDRIALAASRAGVTVLLKNPRRISELPSALELRTFTAALRGAPLEPALDLPAAHLAASMRLRPLRETVVAFGSGPVACLGDACGAVGALAPGHGEVDVAAVARALPGAAHRAFLPWVGLRLTEIADAYHRVANLPR